MEALFDNAFFQFPLLEGRDLCEHHVVDGSGPRRDLGPFCSARSITSIPEGHSK